MAALQVRDSTPVAWQLLSAVTPPHAAGSTACICWYLLVSQAFMVMQIPLHWQMVSKVCGPSLKSMV